MAATTFTPLLRSAWQQFRSKMQTIVTGAALFSVVISILQMPSDVDNLHHTASLVGGIGLIVATIMTFASFAFYVLVAVRTGVPNLTALSEECVRRSPSFIGLAFWVMVRTLSILIIVGSLLLPIGAVTSNQTIVAIGTLFLLVGLIGVLTWGPRYLLAPAFWALESKGVFASAQRSFRATRGYWAKVLGNVLFLSLIFFFIIALVSAFLGAITTLFGTSGQLLLSVLLGFVSQCYQGFLSIFLVLLAETVAAHPIKK